MRSQVIKAAIKKGVKVILATGKARPAAIEACKKFGLEGAYVHTAQYHSCLPVMPPDIKTLIVAHSSLPPWPSPLFDAGKDLLVSSKGPGLFLQGLAVHGLGGVQLSDAELPRSVVEAAFR